MMFIQQILYLAIVATTNVRSLQGRNSDIRNPSGFYDSMEYDPNLRCARIVRRRLGPCQTVLANGYNCPKQTSYGQAYCHSCSTTSMYSGRSTSSRRNSSYAYPGTSDGYRSCVAPVQTRQPECLITEPQDVQKLWNTYSGPHSHPCEVCKGSGREFIKGALMGRFQDCYAKGCHKGDIPCTSEDCPCRRSKGLMVPASALLNIKTLGSRTGFKHDLKVPGWIDRQEFERILGSYSTKKDNGKNIHRTSPNAGDSSSQYMKDGKWYNKVSGPIPENERRKGEASEFEEPLEDGYKLDCQADGVIRPIENSYTFYDYASSLYTAATSWLP